MKKIQQPIKPSRNSRKTIDKTNQQGIYIQNDILPDLATIMQSKCATNKQPCKGCAQKSLLIAKYTDLIKLLKIKIKRLEKHLDQISPQKPKDLIHEFDDFKMDLDSGSLYTIKNHAQKPQNPLRQIQIGSIILPSEKQVAFDKTVKKSSKQKNKIIEKTSKKFASQLKILQEEFQNRKDIVTRTEKEIFKPQNRNFLIPHPNHEIGKEISFTHLIEKSQISLQSAKHLTFNTYENDSGSSSIKVLTFRSKLQKSHNNIIQFKSDSRQNSDNINQNDYNQKLDIFQKRIIFLSETILELKTFLLHVRHSIYQFVKMTDTSKLKSKQAQGNYMLGVIVKMFEFSEEELQQMFEHKKTKSPTSNFASMIRSKIGR